MKSSQKSIDTLQTELNEVDARLFAAFADRIEVERKLAALRPDADQQGRLFFPEKEADTLRQVIERNAGTQELVSLEHVWRAVFRACDTAEVDLQVHLDGSAELIDMLDLARFNFGFAANLVPAADAADVVGAVSDSAHDVGVVALNDRAELPWWRGLGESGVSVQARLPFVLLDERPADLPALVLAKVHGMIDNPDIAVYDARWSEVLPGRLMAHRIEVLSFFRSANGVDALLAISGELSDEDVMKACAKAGAKPDVLRCVGGYAAPIDGDPGTSFDSEGEDL